MLLSKLPKGSNFYKSLKQYILSQDQLTKNGFSRPHSSGDPDRAQAKFVDPYVHDETRRTCERFKRVYAVRPDGTRAKVESCGHHAGKMGKINAKQVDIYWKSYYTCCAKGGNSHWAVQYKLSTFQSHLRCPVCIREAGDEKIMGNNDTTTEGSELARATFVGLDGEQLLIK